MNYSFLDFLTLLGSLGMFLYGMKIMSEGLQKVAGDKLRNILSVMTTNRITGVLTGMLVTALIQSSSATTVMVVSFVNAGLLTLGQSISVIMGANVGTTVTAWIISFFGFKFDISMLSLPLMGLAIPLMFAKKSNYKSLGEFILGFAFLFLGLSYLKDSVPDLEGNPEVLSFIQNYTSMGYLSLLIFLAIGTILTIIVQSSSATVAITLIMCTQGWMPFEMAAAMVLGENIGTTITANLAALSGNVSARRAALAHLMFNLFGVVWVMILFYPFCHPVASLTDPHLIGLREQLQTQQVAVSYGLSLFHTLFNVCNILVMIWFVKLYERICSALIKSPRESEDEEFQLTYISAGLLSTSELSLVQANKEIAVFSDRTYRMFGMIKTLLHETDGEKFLKTFVRVEKYEQISDRMEVEIANYLTRVLEGRLSAEGKNNIRVMLRAVSEIESIADSCNNIARTIKHRNDDKGHFTEEQNHSVEHMMSLTDAALVHMKDILHRQAGTRDDMVLSYNLENEINSYRNMLKNENIDNIDNKRYSYSDSVYYMDIISEYEKMGDYILNVVQAIVEKKF